MGFGIVAVGAGCAIALLHWHVVDLLPPPLQLPAAVFLAHPVQEQLVAVLLQLLDGDVEVEVVEVQEFEF